MNARTTILLIIFCTLAFKTIGQTSSKCDSIVIYNTEFDKLFQKEYNSIDADSILAIRHCFSTNGCSKSFGILCWKIDNKFYFKKMQKMKNKTKITSKINNDISLQLIDFYNKKLFEKFEVNQENTQFWIDDGPLSIIVFKSKSSCWSFEISSSNSNDLKSVWMKELMKIMQK
jgi:hypothetical protein